VLAPSGSGTVGTGWKQGRVLSRLQCQSHESGGRRDRGPIAGEQHVEQSACAGSLTVESIPTRTSTSSFAGRRVSAVSAGSGRARRVSSPAQHRRVSDHGVLEQSRRRGASIHLDMRRRMRGEGRSFTPGGSAHAVCVVVHLVFGATGSEFVSLPASGGTKCDDLRRSYPSACLQRREANVVEADVARCPPISKGMGCRMPHRPERARAGSGGRTRRACGSKRAEHSRRARIGRSNGLCSRVVCLVAEIDRRRRTQRSVRSPFHPI